MPLPSWLPAWVDGGLGHFNDGPKGISPLVVDLDGDGIETTRLGIGDAGSSATYFDLTNDGMAERTGWVTGGDGLLALDRNGNGAIDNQSELFGNGRLDGSNTLYGNPASGGAGAGAADGFAALRTLDSNADGRITAADTQWNALRVWIDADGDAVTDAGELKTLAQLGITAINLGAAAPGSAPVYNNGNLLSAATTFTINGASRSIADIWFATDLADTRYTGNVSLDARTLFLPTLKGFGALKDLHVQMSADATLMNKVSAFVAGWSPAKFGTPDALDAQVKDILFRWAGVDGVNPAKFGPYIDFREVAFLEKMSGLKYTDQYYSENLPSPYAQQSVMFHQGFDTVLDAMRAQLILQSGGTSLDAQAPVFNPANGSLTGGTLSQSAIAGLSATASASGNAGAFWKSLFSFLFEAKIPENFSAQEIGWVETAMRANVPSLSWAGMVADIRDDDYGAVIQGDRMVENSDPNQDLRLVGTENDDTIQSGAGNDVIDSGAGRDLINSGMGNDTIWYTAGTITIQDTGGIDAINIKNTSTTAANITLRRLSDYTSDLEILLNGTLAFRINGQFATDGGIETLNFANGTTFNLAAVQYTNNGTAGNDNLQGISYGGNPNDIIYGNAGDDYIYGLAGDDSITGGAGNDTLDGGAGNDTYYYAVGAGLDTIYETSGIDTIQVGSGFAKTDFTFQRAGSNLLLFLKGVQVFTIYNHFADPRFAVETIRFADNSTVALDALNFVTNGTAAADTLYGVDNVLDTLNGLGGNDYLYGYSGNDTLSGGTGTDYLAGGSGNDIFVFAVGDSAVAGAPDTIAEYSGEGMDTVKLTGVLPANVTLWSDSYAGLTIQYSASDKIYAYGAYNSTLGGYVPSIEKIVFDNGTMWDLTTKLTLTDTDEGRIAYGTVLNDIIDGRGGNDTLYGYGGNDTLKGGAGNDSLYGDAGDDIYVYSAGLDTVSDNGGGNDTLLITGGKTVNDISFTDFGPYNTKIILNAGVNEINIDYLRYAEPTYKIESIAFDDGFKTKLDTYKSWIWGTDAAATTNGTSAADTIIAKGGNDTVTGAAGNDLIHGGAGDDTLYGGNDLDILFGGLGNDTLYGDAGNDRLYGDAGANTLYGGVGSDSFIFMKASAFDTVDQVGDFKITEADRLDIADILDMHNPGDALSGFIRVTETGTNSFLWIDADGGANSFVQIAQLTGVTNFTAAAMASEAELQALVTSGAMMV